MRPANALLSATWYHNPVGIPTNRPPARTPKPQLDHNPWGDSDRENTQQTDP